MIEQYGLLEEPQINPLDWRAGGVSGAVKKLLRESGNYNDVLPAGEYQNAVYFDTMACVSFSANNCIEILAKVMGLDWNKSDRFTAKMSGTGKSGNYLSTVADTVRLAGMVDEEAWPFPRKQREPVFDWDDYYAAIPTLIQGMGRDWLKGYVIQWEWQNVNALDEALKYGPVQVTVQAWPKDDAQGFKTNWEGHRYNHAVTLINKTAEYCEIFDHYDKLVKKLSPNYKFGSALQFYVIKKEDIPMPTITLPDNILVQDSEPGRSGAFAMHLKGKLWVGPAAEVLATVVMRSPRKLFEGQKVIMISEPVGLTAGDWDNFDKVDMSGNPIPKANE